MIEVNFLKGNSGMLCVCTNEVWVWINLRIILAKEKKIMRKVVVCALTVLGYLEQKFKQKLLAGVRALIELFLFR